VASLRLEQCSTIGYRARLASNARTFNCIPSVSVTNVVVNEAVIANMELVMAQGLRDGQPLSVDAIVERIRVLGVQLPHTLDWLFNYGGR
jgi:hypothetical protein